MGPFSMAIIITACSNRKSDKPSQGMRGRSIPKGLLREVGQCWVDRVRVSGKRVPAGNLYQGRGFFEARAAAETLGCDLHVVSAGLGLISHMTPVPPYSITVANGSVDDIRHRVTDLDDDLAARWWDIISRKSPLGTATADLIREISGPVLIALPSGYLRMIATDLASLHGRSIQRLRIFTLAAPGTLPAKLKLALMPYDNRLDGPDSDRPGTRSDFATRALRHFVDHVLSKSPRGNIDSHRRAVAALLSQWRRPKTPVRKRRTDDELKALIRSHWRTTGGRSARMLRVLRDDLQIACEQARFAKLFKEVSSSRKRLR